MSDWRGAQQDGGTLTHLNCLTPVCWRMWRLRWDFLENRRPQPAAGHWHGDCKRFKVKPGCHITDSQVAEGLPRSPLRCGRSRVPSASTVWWKWLRSLRKCSWTAAEVAPRPFGHCEDHPFPSDANLRPRHGSCLMEWPPQMFACLIDFDRP